MGTMIGLEIYISGKRLNKDKVLLDLLLYLFLFLF